MASTLAAPSFGHLGVLTRPWTAQQALDLLPENNGPRVEVVGGSVVVSPGADFDLRDRGPSLVLHELADGEYVPVVAAAGGGTFAMREPFAFEIDPADLLDEEG
ncbi:hypothetical protein [Pseudosporangium ferrugineum]|uniref:Uncharacterized protein n=1 Tax=Pseudosporangium ferrugineum TaxID=439699 RepID=A0A2T0SCI0_9ACTN|nr:hypothetical protein [Pseudosporangium ferrugineum]PRY31128.1 hypothetical protein CLV70_10312 [Pseudosporangium ferrugineum]